MKTTRKFFLVLIPLLASLWGCSNLTKEVQIEFPQYDRQLLVECYLEVGSPMYMWLGESLANGDVPDTPFVGGATIVITHNGIRDTLKPFFADFIYISNYVVPPDYDVEYQIEVRDPKGRIVRGTTKVMPPIAMEPISALYNADSMASMTIRWPDPAGSADFYRYLLYKDAVTDSTVEYDFTLDDRIGDGEMLTIGTLFDYKAGDVLIGSLYHISESYWQYLNSLSDAAGSNGNPFAQPGSIRSNVTGGLGIFTGYEVTRDTFLVP